jgi:hypothetical protein
MERVSDPKATAAYKNEHPSILPNSSLPDAVKKTVFATLPGQITDPLQFGNAFYIFQVVSLKAAPVAEVSDLIASELRQKRLEAEIKQLKEEAKVEVRTRFTLAPGPVRRSWPGDPGRSSPRNHSRRG